MTWALDVYTSDKRCAELCRGMQQVGFGFDLARAAQMRDQLRAVEAFERARAESAVGRKMGVTKTGGFGSKDLERAFFDDLRAPVLKRSELTNKPALGVDVLKAYCATKDERLRELSDAVLKWRRARKIRGTYIDGVKIGSDGRVHATWLNYGTISGRWSSQSPNLQNLPRRENDPTWAEFPGGIRSLYVPRAGHVLVIFDAKQLEMRIAAYASGDSVMVAACESSDLHAANAHLIFGEGFLVDRWCELDARKATGGLSPDESIEHAGLKALRTMAKTSAFAVGYGADATTVHNRIVASWDLKSSSPTLRQVEAMLLNLRKRFWVYYRWQSEQLLKVVKNGYVASPILGRRRWVGHDPSPTEVMNFPIQSGAGDLMNSRLPEIELALRIEYNARLVAQVHDSGVFETPEANAEAALARAGEIFTRPIDISSSGQLFRPSFPIDGEVSERWH